MEQLEFTFTFPIAGDVLTVVWMMFFVCSLNESRRSICMCIKLWVHLFLFGMCSSWDRSYTSECLLASNVWLRGGLGWCRLTTTLYTVSLVGSTTQYGIDKRLVLQWWAEAHIPTRQRKAMLNVCFSTLKCWEEPLRSLREHSYCFVTFLGAIKNNDNFPWTGNPPGIILEPWIYFFRVLCLPSDLFFAIDIFENCLSSEKAETEEQNYEILRTDFEYLSNCSIKFYSLLEEERENRIAHEPVRQ